ncbi:MAG: hypothetical protein AB7G75_05450 [Candidatus Binatia bacterium]
MTIYLIITGCLLLAAGLMGVILSFGLLEKIICGGVMLIGVGLGIVGLQVSNIKKD